MKIAREAGCVALLALAMAFTACTAVTATEPAADDQESPAGTGVTVERPTVAATATARPPAPVPSPTPTGTIVPPTPQGEEGQMPGIAPLPFPGIVYQSGEELFQLDAQGRPKRIAGRPDLQLSPDGTHGLYIEDGDVWLLDLAGGDARNVTADSGRTHHSAQWWPARPETLVLTSWGEGDFGPNSGRLTLVNVDGSDYRLANESGAVSFALPAPGPDGETIAYDEAGKGMLYRLREGATPFEPAIQGLPQEITVARMASPAWSPEGSRIAWVLGVTGGGYGSEGSWDVAVGVFDLQEQTAQLLHAFQPVGRGGWFQPPVWSPDGQMLAFLVESVDASETGIWVAAADGSSERQLKLSEGNVGQAWWSPAGTEPWQDGAFLLVGTAQTESGISYKIIQRETWVAGFSHLPPEAIVRDWRALP